jgi:hypothetical protein
METQIVAGEGKETETVQDTPVNVRSMSYEDLQKSLVEPEPEQVQEPENKEPEPEEVKPPEQEVKEPEPEPEKPVTQEKEPEQIDYGAQIEELKRALEAKEQFIARQGTEIGILRKQSPAATREQIQALEAEYNRIYEEQGKFEAERFWDAVKEQQQKEASERDFAQRVEHIKSTRDRVVRELPTFESAITDITDVLKDDGFRDDFIEQFKQNPYIVEHGELRLLHKAAVYRKESVSLKTENETLRAKIAELEKRPDELVEKIQNATKSVNGKSAGTAAPGKKVDVTTLNPRRMSYEQLKEYEKSLGG